MAYLGLSLDDAARFEVETKYLFAVIEGREPLNTVLAVNLEKAGISTASTWLAMQQAFDTEKAMTQQIQDEQIEPFFITEEIEAEMTSRGYVFEPPNHARTVSLPEILAALSDEELARWDDSLADEERKKRLQRRNFSENP